MQTAEGQHVYNTLQSSEVTAVTHLALKGQAVTTHLSL